jgi:hypothetical protein
MRRYVPMKDAYLFNSTLIELLAKPTAFKQEWKKQGERVHMTTKTDNWQRQ